MSPPIVADTGGLLRALARTSRGRSSFPEYEARLRSASFVIVPGLGLAEVDYFLRDNRVAMRKLVAEIVALELDAKFGQLNLGIARRDGRRCR